LRSQNEDKIDESTSSSLALGDLNMWVWSVRVTLLPPVSMGACAHH